MRPFFFVGCIRQMNEQAAVHRFIQCELCKDLGGKPSSTQAHAALELTPNAGYKSDRGLNLFIAARRGHEIDAPISRKHHTCRVDCCMNAPPGKTCSMSRPRSRRMPEVSGWAFITVRCALVQISHLHMRCNRVM